MSFIELNPPLVCLHQIGTQGPQNFNQLMLECQVQLDPPPTAERLRAVLDQLVEENKLAKNTDVPERPVWSLPPSGDK